MADNTADTEKRKAALERSRRWRAAHPTADREYYRRNRGKILERSREYRRRVKPPSRKRDRKHGSDWRVAYAEFWEAQDGCCYLCGDPLDLTKPQCIVFDHNHACCPSNKSCKICRRGLACNRCNRAIGYAQDDPVRLRRMADALEAANLLVQKRMIQRHVQEVLF